MNEKISRSPAAFARRVMMGARCIWIIVEGVGHDIYFYDRVMRTSQRIVAAGHRVQDAKTIEFHKSTAGGKQRLLAMHDYFKETGQLRQNVAGEDKFVFFAVDRDMDGIVGRLRRSPHIIYTEYRDVEAEILARGQLEESLAAVLGLTHEEATIAAHHLGDPLDRLASLWREWILICALFTAFRVRPGLQLGSPSVVNEDHYGAVMETEFDSMLRRAMSAPDYSHSKHTWLEGRVSSRHRNGLLTRDIKGKLVSRYVEHVMRDHFAQKRHVDLRGFCNSLEKVTLKSVQFERSWTDRWVSPIEKLLLETVGENTA